MCTLLCNCMLWHDIVKWGRHSSLKMGFFYFLHRTLGRGRIISLARPQPAQSGISPTRNIHILHYPLKSCYCNFNMSNVMQKSSGFLNGNTMKFFHYHHVDTWEGNVLKEGRFTSFRQWKLTIYNRNWGKVLEPNFSPKHIW